MEATRRRQIILAVDGSNDALTRILGGVGLQEWRDDQLILVAITPRPVEVRFYEPQYFERTISPEDFESIKGRLQRCCENLVAEGYEARFEVMHRDDPRGLKAMLMALTPSLVITHRPLHSRTFLDRFRPSNCSYLIDLLPCQILVV